jgi:hypothetical protein
MFFDVVSAGTANAYGISALDAEHHCDAALIIVGVKLPG